MTVVEIGGSGADLEEAIAAAASEAYSEIHLDIVANEENGRRFTPYNLELLSLAKNVLRGHEPHRGEILVEILVNQLFVMDDLFGKKELGPNKPKKSLFKTDPEPKPSFRKSLLIAIWEALCTSSSRFKRDRGNVIATTNYIIGGVGASLGAKFGFAAAAVSALVASILSLIGKIGLVAFCRHVSSMA